MVEFIGAAAAIPQLAKYSFSAINAVPDFTRRLRKAPVTQRQWDDQAILLASLTRTFEKQPSSASAISPDIIDRIDEDLKKILPLLRNTTTTTGDGRVARMRKRIEIIRKEAEINQEFSVVVQKSMLYSQLLVLESIKNDIGSADIQHSASASSTLVNSLSQPSLRLRSPQLDLAIGSITRHPSFIGQKDLLRVLYDKIDTSAGSTIAISGLGGVGKSELALELAHMRHTNSQEVSLFWLDASTEDSLIAGLWHIGQCAHISEVTDSSEPDATAVISWLNSTDSGPWLLIMDNADFSTFAKADFHNLLLQKPKCHILLTTRNRQYALAHVHPVNLIEMPRMSIADARELLYSYIEPIRGSNEDITRLIRYLECNSFALTQIGRYMRSTFSTPAKCLALLEHDESFIPMLLKREQNDMTMSGLRATINPLYSLDTVAARNQDVHVVFYVLACINRSDLSDEVANAITDTTSKKHALDLLKSYYLITPADSHDAWQMSTLVRSTARDQMLRHPGRVQYLEEALRLIASINSSHGQNIALQHYAHVDSLIATITECATQHELSLNSMLLAVQLATRSCQTLVAMGKAICAVQIVSRLIAWAPTRIKNLVSSFDKLRSKLGAAHRSHGQFADAESITRDVLRSQISVIGEDHVDTLHSLNNMGVILQDQGRFSMAESYHRKALEMKHRLFGAQHLETLLTLNNLALALQSLSRHDEAEALFRRVLRARRRLLPSDHIDILVSISNLGVQLQLRGRTLEAQKMHEAALAGRERVLGHRHPETLKSKGNLVLVLSRQGRHEQCTEMLREVCLAYKETLGASHPDTIKSLRNLAILLHQQSRLDEAEGLMLEVLSALEKEYGKGHLNTFGTLQYLATLLHLQGKFDEACEIVTWLFETRAEIFGEDHLDTRCSRDHMRELEEDISVRSGLESFLSFAE